MKGRPVPIAPRLWGPQPQQQPRRTKEELRRISARAKADAQNQRRRVQREQKRRAEDLKQVGHVFAMMYVTAGMCADSCIQSFISTNYVERRNRLLRPPRPKMHCCPLPLMIRLSSRDSYLPRAIHPWTTTHSVFYATCT